jgi:hypothetical protein
MAELNEGRSNRNWHSSVHAFLRFCYLVRKGKDRMVVPAASRCRMPNRSCIYARRGNPAFIPLDELGVTEYRGALRRSL